MTFEERIKKMDKKQLEKFLNTLQATINDAPMLSEEQEKDLTNSVIKVLSEINKITTKDELLAKITELSAEDAALRTKKEAIIAKYQRPTQWIRDNQFVEIARRRIDIESELAELYTQIEAIKDREWAEKWSDIHDQ